MISVMRDGSRRRRRFLCGIAVILGRPDKPGDDEQMMME